MGLKTIVERGLAIAFQDERRLQQFRAGVGLVDQPAREFSMPMDF
jgi:hypothetical protein